MYIYTFMFPIFDAYKTNAFPSSNFLTLSPLWIET